MSKKNVKDEKKVSKKKEPFIKIEFKKMTKQEKEIQKKVMKLNKVTKILGILFILLIVFILINNLIMSFNEDYAYFYVSNISNLKNGILFWIFSVIPYANFVIPILFFAVLVFFSLRTDNLKLDVKKRNSSFNILLCLFFVFIYVFTISTLGDNQYYYHIPNFDTLLFEETKDKIYTVDDLIILNNYLKDKVVDYANTMERDKNGNVILNGNHNKIASNDLNNISDEIELLSGLYPIKSNNLSDLLKGMYGSDTVGLTTSYTTYLDYNASPVVALNTITHEYCHTKGIVRENETVFCSFLAGAKSDNAVSNYSAYLEAFSRSNYALSYIDSKSAIDIEDSVLKLCLTEGYTELCDMYIKNNTGFIPGVEELRITSYKLLDYKNYKDELINSLNILSDNDAVFKVDDAEVTIDEIINLIDSDCESFLRIVLKLDSKVYYKIEDAIKNENLFISIYQKDLDEEEAPEIENPVEYFLSPFPTNDEGIFTEIEYSYETYTYERAARLFLEYFDKYGYN